MRITALIIPAMLAGCVTARLEPLALLLGQTEAVAFRARDPERQEGRKVSVAGLPEILVRATWVAGQPFHKGGNWVRFADGREVFLPVSFEFVFVRGAAGHFAIRKEDHPRYREIALRIRKEANAEVGTEFREHLE